MGKTLLLVVNVVCMILAFLLQVYPWYASCRVEWDVRQSCDAVRNKLHEQMLKWQGRDTCPNNTGENCLYTVNRMSNVLIRATHVAPVDGNQDSLTFTFTEDQQICKAVGYSSSGMRKTILDQDYRRNYCGLSNLVVGSGISLLPGFHESTFGEMCTRFTAADCNGKI